MDVLGTRLVLALTVEKNLTALTVAKIDRDDVFDDAQKALDWVVDYYRTKGDWPNAKQVEENTGVELPEEVDELAYVSNLVRQRKLSKKINAAQLEANKLIETRKPDDALSVLRQVGSDLREFSSVEAPLSFADRRDERLKVYDELKAVGGYRGLPTPWPSINGAIQGWVNGTLNVVIGFQNVGKAQPNTQPVLTPSGFVPMGSIKSGDLVATVDGTFTKVRAVFPQGKRAVYRVTFNDRTSTLVCGEHLWKVKKTNHRKWRTLTTEELISWETQKERPWRIPMTAPVQFSKKELPMNPYLLGVLLGDGTLSGNSFGFTSIDDDIIEEVRSVVATYGCELTKRKNTPTFDIVGKVRRTNPLRRLSYTMDLRKTAHHKEIPHEYFYSDVEDRLSILQGLLDTDGSVCERGGIEFCSVSKRLIDGVAFLVQSLGGVATICPRIGSWRLYIKLPKNFAPFRLGRKLDNYRWLDKKRPPFRAITAIEKIEEKTECTCLSVAHPSHLYLTNDFIVTHNSWFLCVLADHAMMIGKKVLFITLEMAAPRIERRVDAVHYGLEFKGIRDGELDIFSEDKWRDTVGTEVLTGDIITADKKLVRTVADAHSLVTEYKPDLVLIDGGYRFVGSGKSQWEQAVDVINDLQIAAEITDVPWVVTTQYGDAKEGGKKPKKDTVPDLRAWAVRYAKEWVINPDAVLGLAARGSDRSELYVQVLKVRDGAGEHKDVVPIKWDTAKMDFSEIPDDPDDVDDDFEEAKTAVKF